jgi:hypothetical protein
MKRIFYFLALALFLILPLKMSAVGTDVSSNITSPTWTADNSPYVISGVIEVARGAVLKIEAGTEIRFNPGAKIVVRGELNAQGTAINPITMTLNATTTSGVWNGIEFTPEAIDATVNNGQYVRGSIIKNTVIKFGQGIKCDDASPYIADNQIMNNVVGLEISGTSGASGGISLGAGADANTVNPQYVVNNVFTANTVGITINRNNSRSYILTPAGYSYFGDKVVTVYLDNNSLNSNGIGVNIAKGDNNILTDNVIKYNSVAGVKIAETSAANVLERNNINNNEIGLDLAALDTVVLQNNIKNNFNLGVRITKRPGLFRFNNVYNNVKYNLNNNVYNLVATENYWGSDVAKTIEATFLNRAVTATGATTTDTLVYPTIYDPFLLAEKDIETIINPILDSYATSTVSDQATISGWKPLDVTVYVNDKAVSTVKNSSTWEYKVLLSLGENNFIIYYQDAAGLKSGLNSIIIRRENSIAAPTLNSYATSTTAASLVLSGTKPADTSIVINEKEAVAANSATTWTYTLPLSLGSNSLEIVAKDGNQISTTLNLTITRVKNTDADIVAQEKKTLTTVDVKLALKLSGRLLLQVEKNGFIWYVNPKNNLRYFISSDSALSIFRALSLGISEANLNLIPTKVSGAKGNMALRNRLKGRLLLRVEKNGQISYVDNNGYRNDISQENLMDIFRGLSLGISNANLNKIGIGELK